MHRLLAAAWARRRRKGALCGRAFVALSRGCVGVTHRADRHTDRASDRDGVPRPGPGRTCARHRAWEPVFGGPGAFCSARGLLPSGSGQTETPLELMFHFKITPKTFLVIS